MRDPAYAAFSALDPFFNIVRQGLAGLVDGDHYFDTIAPDAVFEFRYRFPGYPTKIVGRDALMALYAGYGSFSRMAVSQQGGRKKRNNGEPAQHSSVNYRRAARPKKTYARSSQQDSLISVGNSYFSFAFSPQLDKPA